MEDLTQLQKQNDCIPDSVGKPSILSRSWFSLFNMLWILWKLPSMYSADLGRLGPGFGCGAGFGFGIGFGLIGGAGIGFGLPGMQLGFGLGAGFGIGVGFGYGLGKGWAYDEAGKHCNLPSSGSRSRDKKPVLWSRLPLSAAMRDITAVENDEGVALWDQFVCNSNIAFDFLEGTIKRKKQMD